MRTDAVLRWINQERAVKGKEPLTDMPKGVPGNCCKCPVARALGAEVGVATFTYDEDNTPYFTPLYVQEWIVDFDKEGYPELISS